MGWKDRATVVGSNSTPHEEPAQASSWRDRATPVSSEPSSPFPPIDQMGPMDWVKAFGQGLNVYPGLIRAGFAKAKDLLGPGAGPEVSQKEDVGKALIGQGPSTDEYLKRGGMEPGLGRSAVGLAGDMASDPLTYLTGGPASKGLIAAGENLDKVRKVTEHSLPAMVWAFTRDPIKALEVYMTEQALKNKTLQGVAKKGLIKTGESGLVDSAIRQNLKGD